MCSVKDMEFANVASITETHGYLLWVGFEKPLDDIELEIKWDYESIK